MPRLRRSATGGVCGKYLESTRTTVGPVSRQRRVEETSAGRAGLCSDTRTHCLVRVMAPTAAHAVPCSPGPIKELAVFGTHQCVKARAVPVSRSVAQWTDSGVAAAASSSGYPRRLTHAVSVLRRSVVRRRFAPRNANPSLAQHNMLQRRAWPLCALRCRCMRRVADCRSACVGCGGAVCCAHLR